jgi:glycosyltransferase involved in cell wall biosynthesis
MARELNEGMVRLGHVVDVVTTTLTDIQTGRSRRGTTGDVFGVRVHYLATPLRYRWMGITPSIFGELRSLERPDVAHVFGFRDPIGTATAAWCRRHGIPYVFEPLGMFAPRIRKVRLKRILDRSVFRAVADAAALIIATSEVEREAIVAAGADTKRVVVRGNGFPSPGPRHTGELRREIGVTDELVVLYVGRLAAGKGIEALLDAARKLPDMHLALVGPDDGHGIATAVRASQQEPATRGRIHVLGPRSNPERLYGDADLFVLPSEGESFGMVAAEAAAAGTPVIVTNRCGVAEYLGDAAVVVPVSRDAIVTAIAETLADPALRAKLADAALDAAARNSWAHVVEQQEALYRTALREG